MEDKKSKSLDSEISAAQGSGSMLSAERKRQKIDIELIAKDLNLSLTQLQSIEADQTDGLPEPTYVRGYIRSYARMLGLDADEVLKHYLNSSPKQTNNLNEIPKRIGSAEESRGRLFTKRRFFLLFLLALLFAGLWFSGLLSNYFGVGGKSQQISADVDNQQTVTVGNTADDSATVATADNSDASDDDSEVSGTDEEVVDSEALAERANASESDSADTISAASTEPNELVLEFSKTSWVDIRDAEDNRLAYKSYAKGEILSVDSKTALSVFIGNAEGVTANYNGKPFDIAEFQEGVYAKFTVGD